eukprot:385422_1
MGNCLASNEAQEEDEQPPQYESALQDLDVQIVTEGNGQKPGATSGVEIEYTGYLYKNNEPTKQFIKHREVVHLGKKQNIKGLEQGVIQMDVGSTAKLYVPSELGYGSRGAGAYSLTSHCIAYCKYLLQYILDLVTFD